MPKEITKVNSAIKKYNIASPAQIVAMSKVLKKHIIDNNLYVQIAKSNYVLVEGWQFAGGLLGFFPKVTKVECLGPNKWMASVEIIRQKDSVVVSTGFALCSKSEGRKSTFDEYAILSMAQTRAIGKAYRNVIGWVIKLAGYEATPAEEMKQGKVAKPKLTIAEIVESIRRIKDKKTLNEMRKKIVSGKLYSQTQKNVLLKAVDEQLKLCV